MAPYEGYESEPEVERSLKNRDLYDEGDDRFEVDHDGSPFLQATSPPALPSLLSGLAPLAEPGNVASGFFGSSPSASTKIPPPPSPLPSVSLSTPSSGVPQSQQSTPTSVPVITSSSVPVISSSSVPAVTAATLSLTSSVIQPPSSSSMSALTTQSPRSAASSVRTPAVDASVAVISLLGATAISVLIIFLCRRRRLLKKKTRPPNGEAGEGPFPTVEETDIASPSMRPEEQGKPQFTVGVTSVGIWDYQKSFARPAGPGPSRTPKARRQTLTKMRQILAAPLTSNPVTRSFRSSSDVMNVRDSSSEAIADEKDPFKFEPQRQSVEAPSTNKLYLKGKAAARASPAGPRSRTDTRSIRTESSAALASNETFASKGRQHLVPSTTQSVTSIDTQSLLQMPRYNHGQSFFSWSESRPTTSGNLAVPPHLQMPRTPVSSANRGSKTTSPQSQRDTIMTSYTDSSEPPKHRSIRSWIINEQLQQERREDRLKAIQELDLKAQDQVPNPRFIATSVLSLSSSDGRASTTTPRVPLLPANAQTLITPIHPARIVDVKAFTRSPLRRQATNSTTQSPPRTRPPADEASSFLDTEDAEAVLPELVNPVDNELNNSQCKKTTTSPPKRKAMPTTTTTTIEHRDVAVEPTGRRPLSQQQDYAPRRKKRDSAATKRSTLSLFRVHPGERWDPRNG